MKTIREIKDELALIYMKSSLRLEDFVGLPKNDELRTFVCSLGPRAAFCYAQEVDWGSHNETREACLSDAYFSTKYAIQIDRCYRKDTYKASLRSEGFHREYVDRLLQNPCEIILILEEKLESVEEKLDKIMKKLEI